MRPRPICSSTRSGTLLRAAGAIVGFLSDRRFAENVPPFHLSCSTSELAATESPTVATGIYRLPVPQNESRPRAEVIGAVGCDPEFTQQVQVSRGSSLR